VALARSAAPLNTGLPSSQVPRRERSVDWVP
jgi:hypothetical protein